MRWSGSTLRNGMVLRLQHAAAVPGSRSQGPTGGLQRVGSTWLYPRRIASPSTSAAAGPIHCSPAGIRYERQARPGVWRAQLLDAFPPAGTVKRMTAAQAANGPGSTGPSRGAHNPWGERHLMPGEPRDSSETPPGW